MDIGPLSPRKGDTSRCPYCHDDIQQGPSCSACGARYHVECAQTFGACAVQGCRGEVALDALGAAPQVLPRLAALAKRIGRWSPPDGGPRALILDLPAPKAVRDDPGPAARVIAELLGQTPYDGRMRVLSPFPEPLVRVRSAAEAERIQARLRGVGLSSIVPSLETLVRPFAGFEAARVRVEPDRVDLEDVDGQTRTVWNKGPRLLLSTGIVQQTQVTGRLMAPRTHTGRGSRTSARAARQPGPRRERERCAFLFERGNPDPVIFKASTLGREALRGASTPVDATGRFHGLLESLETEGSTRRNVPEVMAANQVFMHPVDGLGKTRSNAAFVALLARLSYLCWLETEPEGKAT